MRKTLTVFKEKYGYKSTEDLFRFLVTIFAQIMLSFYGALMKLRRMQRMNFIKDIEKNTQKIQG